VNIFRLPGFWVCETKVHSPMGFGERHSIA
jgi:hypothetical protein